MHFLDTGISSLNSYLFKSYTCLLINCLFVPERFREQVNEMLIQCIPSTFLYSAGCLLTFFTVSFDAQIFLILIKSSLILFYLYCCIDFFVSFLGNHYVMGTNIYFSVSSKCYSFGFHIWYTCSMRSKFTLLHEDILLCKGLVFADEHCWHPGPLTLSSDHEFYPIVLHIPFVSLP